MKFLRDNWAWVLVPTLIFAVAAALVLRLFSGDPEGGFRYPL